MAGFDGRLSSWLDVVDDLLRQRLTVFPHRALLQHFAATFDAEPSWNWHSADGDLGFELLRPPPNWPPRDELDYWRSGGMLRHPLIKWYAVSQVTEPQTIGRVPFSVSGHADRDIVSMQLRPVGLDEQLSIPYRLGANSTETFVLARTGRDFGDAEVELARRLQPLIHLLARQVSVLGMAPATPTMLLAAGLTGREIAVMRLLAEGHTATAIAHRLGSSPRTVHKHLEHIYRKLGVSDRLTAVRSAEVRGLLTAS